MQEINTSSDIAESLRRIFARLDEVRRLDRSIVRSKTQPIVHTRMQSVFNLKFTTPVDRTLHELVMTHAVAAEKLGPGAFNRCIDLIIENSRDHVGVEPGHEKRILSTKASSGAVARLVASFAETGGPRTVAMLNEAMKLAGHGGRIIVEKTSSSTPSVELVRGYTFELQQLLPIDVSFIQPRIICIDGFIEDVSEIHHILEAASSAKEPCILFLRGVSEDVKHTLKVNYDRGSLRVVPVGVKFDLEGMNSIVDLSVATGAELVSSLKGDLISSIKFHETPYVDQVTIFKGRTVVMCPRTRFAVATHVATLRKRRQEEKLDDVGTLLDKRIRSLSPNHVVIRLPDDKDFVLCSQAIDYALRAVKSAIERGITGNMPAATELAAQTHARRCLRTLNDLGAYLM